MRGHWGIGVALLLAIKASHATAPLISPTLDLDGAELQQPQEVHPRQQLRPKPTPRDDSRAESLYELAVRHINAGRASLAAAALEETLRIVPHHAEAINAAGVVQYRAGNLPQALQLYLRAAVLSPRGSQVYSNLAAALMDARRLREAAAAAIYSVQLAPLFAAGYVNLGVMLKEMHHDSKAVAAYRMAVRLDPTVVEAGINLASVLRQQGKLGDALTALQQCSKIPQQGIQTQTGFLLTEQLVLHSSLCSWRGQRRWSSTISRVVKLRLPPHAFPPRLLELAQVYINGDLIRHKMALDAAAQYAVKVSAEAAAPKQRVRPSMRKARRLRIGYVSSDYGDTAVGRAVHGVLALHDKTKLQLCGYRLASWEKSATADGISRAFVGCDRSLVGLSTVNAADLIRQDQLHILFDLNGNTQNSAPQLFVHQPAAVQALAHQIYTMVSQPSMPYMVSDSKVSPPSLDWTTSERPVLQPYSLHPSDYTSAKVPRTNPEMADTEMVDRPVLLVSSNRVNKLDPACFSTWLQACIRLQNAVTTSIQLAIMLEPVAAAAELTLNLESEAAARGLRPSMFEWWEKVKHQAHLERVAAAELSLDTTILGGGMTAMDSLFAATPWVSLNGDLMINRFGLSASVALDSTRPTGSKKEYEDVIVKFLNH